MLILSVRCLGAVVILLLSQIERSKGGREFYLGYLEFPPLAQPTVHVYIGNGKSRAAYLRVSTPSLSPDEPGYISEQHYVPPHSSINVTIPTEIIQRGTQKSNKVIYIRSSQDVAVQAIVTGTKISDGYSALPTSALGKSYIVTTYSHNNTPPPFRFGPVGIAIIGVQDNTKVSIELHSESSVGIQVSYNDKEYTTGDVIEDVLQKSQSLQIQVNQTIGGDLSGTLITTNKPVAVIMGVGIAHTGDLCMDHMTDILIPVDQLKQEYFIMSTPKPSGDYIRITALTDGTLYTITDETGNITANGSIGASVTVENFVPRGHAYYINASRPVQASLIGSSCNAEPGNEMGDSYFLSIRPMSYGVSEYVLSTMTALERPFTHYLTVLVEEWEIPNLRINGKPIEDSGFVKFWHTPVYGKVIELPPGMSTYIIKNVSGKKFLAYLTEIALNEASVMFLENPYVSAVDANQATFRKTQTGVGISSASLGCTSAYRTQCPQLCMQDRSSCAGVHYNNDKRLCCRLNDNDILFSNRYSNSQSEIWQWSDDVDLYRF